MPELRDVPEVRPETRYPALDGLRGLAILGVLFFHCLSLTVSRPWSALNHIFRSGWLGVPLFFVLSGFLITGILLESKARPRYFRNFYARRTLRIFPLYYLSLALVFWVLPWLSRSIAGAPGFHELKENQAWFWLYAQNWWFIVHGRFPEFSILSHFWSLAIEEQFYLCWPVIVLALSRGRLKTLCALLVVLAFATRVVCLLQGRPWFVGHMATLGQLDALACGAGVAVFMRSGEPITRWTRHATAMALTASLALAPVFWFDRGFPLGGTLTSTVGETLFAMLFAAIVAMVVQDPERPVSRILKLAPLSHLGRLSYGIYVFHWPVHHLTNHLLSQHSDGWGGTGNVHAVVVFLATAVASLLLAAVSWKFFESPILKLKRHFPH